MAINCGALSPQLIASELFGYAPGAFTGAARGGSEGRISAANGGTLFLDEIAEMPETLQASLLRVLEDGEYQRVGEARPRRASFRLICATCRDLPRMVADERFRNDLFYRIQGASVTIPALRDRSDTVWLAQRFLDQLAPTMSGAPSTPPRLSDDAERYIREHDWPGNVRELKTAMTHALALSVGRSLVTRADMPRIMVANPMRGATTDPKTRDEILHDVIEGTLRACNGNVSEAARRLDVGRGTIYRAVKRRKPD